MEATDLITLPVDPETARRFEATTPEAQADLRRLLTNVLEEALEGCKPKSSFDRIHERAVAIGMDEAVQAELLLDVMNATSRQAASRGYDANAEAEMALWLQENI